MCTFLPSLVGVSFCGRPLGQRQTCSRVRGLGNGYDPEVLERGVHTHVPQGSMNVAVRGQPCQHPVLWRILLS